MVKRNVLDAALFILLLMLMSFQFLPKTLHEALGLALPALAVLHLILNRVWFSAVGKGELTISRSISFLVNILLVISLLLVFISGLAIANRLFHGVFGVEWERNILAHQIHVAFSYWLMILSGVHIGLHWRGIWNRFVSWRRIDTAARRYQYSCKIVAVAIITVGICASFMHRIGDRILMKHIFGTMATRLPFPAFLALLLGIVGLYAAIGFAARKILNKT